MAAEYEMILQQVYLKLSDALANLAINAIELLVALIIILFFFLIGYVVAAVINGAIRRVIAHLKIEEKIEEEGFEDALGGYTLTGIVTLLVKVYIVLVFLGAAADVVQLKFFTKVIEWALEYLPSLVQGVAIVVVALLFADYIHRLIKARKGVPIGKGVALVVQVFIAYVAIVLALPLILPGVEIGILETAFTLFVGAIAVAFGLGFAIALGLGLKDPLMAAAKKHQRVFDHLFKEVEEDIKHMQKK